jgi:hypothetical protein
MIEIIPTLEEMCEARRMFKGLPQSQALPDRGSEQKGTEMSEVEWGTRNRGSDLVTAHKDERAARDWLAYCWSMGWAPELVTRTLPEWERVK